MITRKINEEEIKSSLRNKLNEISEIKRDNVMLIKKKDGKNINIITKYDIKKFGFKPGQFVQTGQFVQMLIGPDLRFSRNTICIYVGVNLWGKKKLWFLAEESDGVTSLSFTDFGSFSLMQKEGNLIMLDSTEKQ